MVIDENDEMEIILLWHEIDDVLIGEIDEIDEMAHVVDLEIDDVLYIEIDEVLDHETLNE